MSRLVADPAATHPTSNRQPFRIVRWALRRGELPCVAFSVHIEYAVKGGGMSAVGVRTDAELPPVDLASTSWPLGQTDG